MDFGFPKNKGATNYIGNEDISKETGMKIPHVSKAIKALKKKQFILQGVKSGAKFKYSVNLLRYGLEMKYYRISEDINDIGKGEDAYDKLYYRLGRNVEEDYIAIVYKPKGYDNTKESYIKKEIKKNIKNDKGTPTPLLGSVPKATTKDSIMERKKNEIVTAFKKEITLPAGELPTAETIIKYFRKLHEIGHIPWILEDVYSLTLDHFPKDRAERLEILYKARRIFAAEIGAMKEPK